MGRDGQSSRMSPVPLDKRLLSLAKHADPIVHHLSSCQVPGSAALRTFTGGPPAPPSIFRMLSSALMETVPTKR